MSRRQRPERPFEPPLLLQESDIEILGDLAPEAWPPEPRREPGPPTDWPRYLGVEPDSPGR